MVRTHYVEGQIPMFLPESSWVQPTLPDLGRETSVGIDTETRDDGLAAGRGPGWHAGLGYVAGISVAWRDQAIYINLRHPDSECYDKATVSSWLRKLFSQDHTRFVFFNSNYDLGFLQADLGVPPPRNCVDSAAAAAMVDENQRSYSMEAVCAWRGIEGKDERLLREAAAAFGYQGAQVKANLWRLPARFVAPYAEEDARRPLQLMASLQPEIDAQGMGEAFQLECDLVPLILEMRRRGLRIDVEHAQRTAELFERKRDEALAELARQAGGRWTMTDARSNQRLEPVFNRHGVPFPRTAPTEAYAEGQASFQGDWMRGYEGQAQWLPRLVYAARKYDDLSSKFMRNYILGYAHRGRIHPTVNQFRTEGGGTRSHRVSYSDPPLQQMPSRDDETAPLIRSCFLPEPGELWCACDYSQQEFRLIVHYAELMKKDRADEAGAAYRNNPATDFHDMVAEMTGLPRRRAKDVNFAVAFSAGVGRFADMTGLTREQAQEIMGQYDEKMPFVKQLGQACSALALRRGYIRLIDGARCHFDDWEPGWRDTKKENDWLRSTKSGALSVMPCRYDEALRRTRDEDHPWGRSALRRAYGHKAMNRLIQGSAARQTKRAMLLMYREGIMPRLQMHDEVSASCASKKQGDMIAEMMREAHTLLVPMKVDEEWGVTWGAAAQRKDSNKQVTYRATYEEAAAEQEVLGVS